MKKLTNNYMDNAVTVRSEPAPGGVPTKNLETPRSFNHHALSLTTIVGTPPGAGSLPQLMEASR
jgi:hypothetical protein